MKLGIMQPYFFPYAGHFDLIDRVDRWVVFDVVKYAPKSWMNRNRILHPTQGWQYVTVPVDRQGPGMTIRETRLQDKQQARTRILGQIEHYRRRAPHFDAVRALIEEAFARSSGEGLTELNVNSLGVVCDYLGVRFAPALCSELELDLPPITHPGQWALEISSALGATTYVNPPGGKAIFIQEDWDARGIELQFTAPAQVCYATPGYQFEPSLSIIDVLMWLSPSELMAQLRAGPPPAPGAGLPS